MRVWKVSKQMSIGYPSSTLLDPTLKNSNRLVKFLFHKSKLTLLSHINASLCIFFGTQILSKGVKDDVAVLLECKVDIIRDNDINKWQNRLWGQAPTATPKLMRMHYFLNALTLYFLIQILAFFRRPMLSKQMNSFPFS